MGEYFTKEVSEITKKSDMTAKSVQDVESLMAERTQFLDCRVKEEKESICFYYNIQERRNFSSLCEEKKINKLRALLEVEKLAETFEQYSFIIEPDNLYYDRNYRVFVKKRDLYERGIHGSHEEFLKQYKALIGHAMQKKYQFEDYYLGGKDLFQKNGFLRKLEETKNLKELEALLSTEYDAVEKLTLYKKVEVNKSWYRMNRWCMAAAFTLIAAAGILLAFLLSVQVPRKNAFINASNSYLEGNYVDIIDTLRKVDIRYLDKYQKYILAVSYVKGESLTQEQKENVLENISVDGEEKIKDYWIYLGRSNTLEAENVAMQCSDDELLLYAYMTEKAILEKDTDITGEEKTGKLAELEKKIKELAANYKEEEG